VFKLPNPSGILDWFANANITLFSRSTDAVPVSGRCDPSVRKEKEKGKLSEEGKKKTS
jgi:hypothetical protein